MKVRDKMDKIITLVIEEVYRIRMRRGKQNLLYCEANQKEQKQCDSVNVALNDVLKDLLKFYLLVH